MASNQGKNPSDYIGAFFSSLMDSLEEDSDFRKSLRKDGHSKSAKNTGASGDSGDIPKEVAKAAVETLHNATPPTYDVAPVGGMLPGGHVRKTDPQAPANSAKVVAGENTPQEGDTSSPTHGEIAALQQRIQDKDQIIEVLRSQIETMQRALSQGPPTIAPTKPVGDARLDPEAGTPFGMRMAPPNFTNPESGTRAGVAPLGRDPKLGGAGLAGGGGRPIDPRIALGLGG